MATVINPSGCSDPTNVMVTYTYDFDRIAQSSIHNLQSGDALGSVRQVADAGGAITLVRNYDPFGTVGGVGGAGAIG